jgi:hypothetical protein
MKKTRLFCEKPENKSKQDRRSKERKTAKEEKHELQLTLGETKKEGPEKNRKCGQAKKIAKKSKKEILVDDRSTYL